MKDISKELWREYHYDDGQVVRVENPKQLHVGNTTHRIVDANGLVHIPAPGWVKVVYQPSDEHDPVQF